MANILSLNVRGLQNEAKRKAIFNYIRDKKIHIACLQETHSAPDNEQIWRNQWKGKIIFAHGDSNARGVCVLIKHNYVCDLNGIMLILVVDG